MKWKTWFFEIAPKLFQDFGVEKQGIILDFGARNGDYSVPLALWVGDKGKIIAIDKNKNSLKDIKKRCKKYKLDNIESIHFEWDHQKSIPFDSNYVDTVFIFDVLHFFNKNERLILYQDVFRVIKKNGVLITFPQHNLESYPMGTLAELTIEDIREEIENSGFVFKEKFEKEIIHNHSWYDGIILKFRKE